MLEKCTCKYDKNDKPLSLCHRCFSMLIKVRVKEAKRIKKEIEKAIEQVHGGGNGKRILIQLKDNILC